MKSLQLALDNLFSSVETETRIQADPIRFPKRYQDLLDQEVVALFSALLAYGRVKAIGQSIEGILDVLGDHPGATITADAQSMRDHQVTPRRFQNFVYRFTREADLNKVWVGVGEVILRYGSIGHCFRAHDDPNDPTLLSAYQGFYDDVLTYSHHIEGGSGFNHLFSNPKKGSALKRVNMWLRWMVRGPDQIDIGVWRDLGAHRLLIPLDVHVFRLSSAIGLTQRRTANLKTAIEVTQMLKRFDHADPIKYDFALAHLGISGACKGHRGATVCDECPLKTLCTLPILSNPESIKPHTLS